MAKLKLADAETIIDAALAEARKLQLAPLAVAVLDAGGHVIAFKREDGAGLVRFDIAHGKAWGALGMGFGTREITARAEKFPAFITSLYAISQGRAVPSPGGVLILVEDADSAGSLGTRFEVALKKEIEGGYLPGPRLVSSSLEQRPKDVPGVPPAEGNKHGRGAGAIRAYVAEMAELGVDSIKLLLSGDDAFAPGASQRLTYTEEEVAAAANEAHAHSIWLSCHAQSAESIKIALSHGFRILYHCSHADEEALDLLEAQKDKVFVAPAVGLRYARMHEAEAFGITRQVAEKMGVFAEVERMQKLYPEMRKRGLRVLPGGDYGFPYNPVGRNARDLELFVKLFGYSAVEALVAATKLGGELMGLQVGVVKPDWLADLILVRGNPVENVAILQEPQRLMMIMKDGRIVAADCLPARYRSRY